jgi:ATP-dependent DNA helicase RecQ
MDVKDEFMTQFKGLEAALARFGHNNFRTGQEAVLHHLLESKRALAVFPTGGGKSLCYQLPSLLLDGITLVVSPLIALMREQVQTLQALGIPAARLDSSLGWEELLRVNTAIRNGESLIVYVSPERFNNEQFFGLIKTAKIALFALDEAHCVSQWGHNFRPDYLKLARVAADIGAEHILALTATATPSVVQDICEAFEIPQSATVISGFRRENLQLLAQPTSLKTRDAALLKALQENIGTSIVYATLQRDAERVAEILVASGVKARAYHAGLPEELKPEVQHWWMTTPNAVVVATIAFGMGIDKANVRGVYHYQLPKSLEGYAQEVGRAGRDGLPAIGMIFGSLEDSAILEQFIYGDTPSQAALSRLVDFFAAQSSQMLVSLYNLSFETDLRPLVLRTAITYLELEQVLHQGTPQYDTYAIKFLTLKSTILAKFSGERREFLENIMRHGKMGRDWLTLEPRLIAEQIEQPRERIITALNYLSEQKLIELKVSNVMNQFTRVAEINNPNELVALLEQRFAMREKADLERLNNIPQFLENKHCYTDALANYFGDIDSQTCGKCSVCLGQTVKLPSAQPEPNLEQILEPRVIQALIKINSEALSEPRQLARFLCGMTSPKTTRAKLSRHPLFGICEKNSFPRVLAWCASQQF